MDGRCGEWAEAGYCTNSSSYNFEAYMAATCGPECDEHAEKVVLEKAALETDSADLFFQTGVWTVPRLRMMRLALVSKMRDALRDYANYSNVMVPGAAIPSVPFFDTRRNGSSLTMCLAAPQPCLSYSPVPCPFPSSYDAPALCGKVPVVLRRRRGRPDRRYGQQDRDRVRRQRHRGVRERPRWRVQYERAERPRRAGGHIAHSDGDCLWR